ncbi:MAG TPA: hypothetical protein VFC35_01455 [Gemmatimonadaceae bacterium]|nr:hypothetical protein [Gemmatimonadaceae bacterium]
MKQLLLPILLATVVSTSGAQVRKRAPLPAEPSTWVSLSAGLFNGNTVSDGATGSTWDLGQATNPQLRLAAERSLRGQSQISIGLAGTYTHAPFTYAGTGGASSCAQCAAHLDLVSLGVSFHAGGGIGLHQVLEASAGALQYRNLKRDSDSSPLAPLNGNIDPYFTFGYGFGYTISPTTQISVVQDFGLALHERTGLTSEQSNSLRLRTIRLNLRYGFGDRTGKRK